MTTNLTQLWQSKRRVNFINLHILGEEFASGYGDYLGNSDMKDFHQKVDNLQTIYISRLMIF